MKNFDDPDVDDTKDVEPPARGPHVELVGDPARIAQRFQVAGAFNSATAARRMVESLQLPSATAIKGAREALAKASVLNFKPPNVDLSALIGEVPKIPEIPKIDFETMFPRVEPLEIEMPKPVRPIADIRLEAIAVAVNRLIDVAEKQNEALIALDAAIEARHAESEELADERAADADNRAAWNVTFAAVAAICAFLLVLDILLR